MKGYAGIATGTVAAMISFDVIWNLTTKPVEDCFALSFFVGLGVTLGFIALTDMVSKRQHRSRKVHQTRFIETESGLSVMVQRSSGRRSA